MRADRLALCWPRQTWSAASYAYALVALLPLGTECYLPQLVLPSLQGDSRYLPLYMERLGVYTGDFGGEDTHLSWGAGGGRLLRG